MFVNYDDLFEEITEEETGRSLVPLKSDFSEIFTESVWPQNAIYIKEFGWV